MTKPTKTPDISSQWQVARPDLDPAVNSLISLVYRISQQAEGEFRVLAQSGFDLAAGDLRILLALRRSGPMRPTDLFQSLLITSGAVTKQVQRLEERNLVARSPDPSHRGGSILALSDEGLRIADRAIEEIARSFRVAQAAKDLPRADLEAGLAFLQALFERIEGGESE